MNIFSSPFQAAEGGAAQRALLIAQGAKAGVANGAMTAGQEEPGPDRSGDGAKQEDQI